MCSRASRSLPTDAPAIITGDNYERMASALFDQLLRCKINIFNISKINSEVRGGKSPRIKRLSEYIGESYFEYLAGLAGPRAADGRVAPLPRIGGHARHQRTEARARAWN